MMVGRRVETYLPQHRSAKSGGVRLRVSGLSSRGRIRDINFAVSSGEIVGFAGLVGSSRSGLAQAVFGLDAAATGRVEVDGQVIGPGSVVQAKRAGIDLLPEGRKR